MAERRIGLIPYAMTQDRDRLERCAIFVTDQRTILVFTRPKATFQSVFGNESKRPLALPVQIDFRTVDIDKLAAMNDNISLPHSSIVKFSCGKGIGGYGMWVLYKDDKGRKRGMFADFQPHPERLKELRAGGRKTAEIKREYAERCQEVFRKALPVAIAQEGDWRI